MRETYMEPFLAQKIVETQKVEFFLFQRGKYYHSTMYDYT